ncbi:MAG: CRTAC1 family protein [Planctomycetes bacterium]|nr:CRTAC1 family protein [Planctomycetota bacterium]
MIVQPKRNRIQFSLHAVCFVIVALLLTACGSDERSPEVTGLEPVAPAPFVEVAQTRGLIFTQHSGHQDQYFSPEIIAGGVALLDMDNDGDLDVYLIQSGRIGEPEWEPAGNQLFRNRGDGSFENVTDNSGAEDRGYGMGVATGDYDNDGDVDLYVTNVGRNTLLRNEGNGRFVDVTDEAGVGGDLWSSSAAFLDYDADGDLDLFVCNYIHWSVAGERPCRDAAGAPDYCGPLEYLAPTKDTLYRNNADGSFTDVTNELGISMAVGNGLGVAVGDYNNDGRLDIFVANDAVEDVLWIKGADGRFVNQALTMGCARDEAGQAKGSMGIGSADLDDDGDLDLLIVNLRGETDSLFRNEGSYFADITGAAGLGRLSRGFTRFGVGFFDYDNDGKLDIYQANGRVLRADPAYSENPYAEPNVLMRGVGSGKFAEILPRGGIVPMLAHNSRGAAFGDLDNDGGIDIVVVNRDGPAYYLSNQAPDRGHWIMFRVMDEHGRDALGAVVTGVVNGRTMRRDVQTAYSYCSANDPRVHFGLGDAHIIQNITVHWVDRSTSSFGDFDAGHIVTLRRSEGAAQ